MKLIADYSAPFQILVFMSITSIIQKARLQNKILTMEHSARRDKIEK